MDRRTDSSTYRQTDRSKAGLVMVKSVASCNGEVVTSIYILINLDIFTYITTDLFRLQQSVQICRDVSKKISI